jgi:hypothetical protein
MSVSTIEIQDAANLGALKFSVTLDGTDYQLEFRHNSREDSWYFNLLDVAGDVIRSGIRCVINFPLIRLVREATRPPGELFCLDTRQVPNDPLLADLGINSIISYVDEDQV